MHLSAFLIGLKGDKVPITQLEITSEKMKHAFLTSGITMMSQANSENLI